MSSTTTTVHVTSTTTTVHVTSTTTTVHVTKEVQFYAFLTTEPEEISCYLHLQPLYPRSDFPRSLCTDSPVKAAAELPLTVACAVVQLVTDRHCYVQYLRNDRPCSSLGSVQEITWDLCWTKCQCGTLLSEGFTVHCHERSAVR